MSSYGSSYYQTKGALTSRPSSSSTMVSSNFAQSAHTSRSYGSRPQTVIVHKPSGQIHDPNTSTSAGNAGYYR